MTKTPWKNAIISSQQDEHKFAKSESESLKVRGVENKIVRRGSKYQVWVKR